MVWALVMATALVQTILKFSLSYEIVKIKITY